MNAWKTLKTHAKSGTSLVEMVAALLIFSILMTMIVAVFTRPPKSSYRCRDSNMPR